MKIAINSKDFVLNFINPILEINKTGKVPIFLENSDIYSITSHENLLYLYSKYTPVEIDSPIERFNINLERLKRILAYSTTDKEKPFCEFNITNGLCSYKDANISANIRLIDNNIVSIPKFNVDTFKNFPFTSGFSIKEAVLLNIKKALEFSTETSKFYIQVNDGKLFFLFGDKQTNYNDDIKIFITEEFTGTIKNFIYDTTILKLIVKSPSDIDVKISENGTLLMKLSHNNFELNYITTQLKK